MHNRYVFLVVRLVRVLDEAVLGWLLVARGSRRLDERQNVVDPTLLPVGRIEGTA